jgi:hypothetical protein
MQQLSYAVLMVIILVVTFLALYVLWLLDSIVTIRDILLSPELQDNVTKLLVSRQLCNVG